ncbi:MAG: hypothetical protein INR62_14365 [Rhodospirillales bacterium]|nr:hypothetical protein [Acetobacter sp.]
MLVWSLPPNAARRSGSLASDSDAGRERPVCSYQVRSFEVFVSQVDRDTTEAVV